jgi:hypothetical protein
MSLKKTLLLDRLESRTALRDFKCRNGLMSSRTRKFRQDCTTVNEMGRDRYVERSMNVFLS